MAWWLVLAPLAYLWGSPPVTDTLPFRITDARTGGEVDFRALVGALAAADVVFVGETHDDDLAHALQDTLYGALLAAYGEVALSLEMFETDVQPVVDEYLAGLIDLDRLLGDARAWDNHVTAYHPLVERARAAGQPVVAANAPRRYVSLVGRRGPAALDELPRASRAYLPRRPFRYVDTAYRRRFANLMGGVGGHGAADREADPDALDPFFAAQALWDATMARSIYEQWRRGRRRGAKVFHVTGSFHVEYGQGTVSQLRELGGTRPATATIVVGEGTPGGEGIDAPRADYVVEPRAPEPERDDP